MFTSPIILGLAATLAILFIFLVYVLHCAQLVSDKLDGIVIHQSSTRSLLLQRGRIERTGALVFGAFVLTALVLGGTLEAMPF